MSSEGAGKKNKVVRATADGALSVAGMSGLVGGTPLVRLQSIGSDGGAPIYMKMENLNPSGSMRDRYISEILGRAVAAGMLVPGDTVALAGLDDSAVAAATLAGGWGLKTRIFAPEGQGKRLNQLVLRYGAEIEVTDREEGLSGAVRQAAQWSRQKADRMYVDGYRREAVRDAYSDIASEILEALEGQQLGAFITSVSTGGTFRHVARELRESRPTLHVGGAVLGTLELPDFKEHRFNSLERFSMAEAFEWRNRLASEEGILAGPKGAAGVALAVQLQGELPADYALVSLNPDSGQRYLGWEDKVQFHGAPDI